MECFICGITSEVAPLFEGISSSGMINICRKCAENENIPIIRKPSENQLEQANKNYTVRERMERISTPKRENVTEISKDQSIIQKNLNRLKIPPKKETREEVVDDYYWELNMARRRRKLSINQTSEMTGIAPEIIEGIEKGKIPKDFEDIFTKLEKFFGITLLRIRTEKVNFRVKQEDEARILREVEEKMKGGVEKEEHLSKISKGDLSKIKDLSRITISDLQDLKKKKEQREQEAKKKEMIDEDFELDLDEGRS